MPQKVAGNSPISANRASDVFYTKLDAFRGNSGSPVFNAATHDVEGILIGGPLDIRPSANGGCISVHRCDDDCKGELVVRISEIQLRSHLI